MLAALTFLAPSAPTYDPWAWIVWGREVLHLDLSTVDGPSWKPLPVLLTTPFALTGPLAPTSGSTSPGRARWRASSSSSAWCAASAAGSSGASAAAAAYAVGAVDDPQRARWATPRACSSRSRWARSTATWPAGAAPSLRARRSARRCCGPRRGRSSASTALLLWREPAAAAARGGRLRPPAGAVAAAGAVGLGRPAARGAPRPQTPRADSAAFAQDPAREVLDAVRVPADARRLARGRRPRRRAGARARPRRCRHSTPSCAPSAAWRWAPSRGSARRLHDPTAASRATPATSSCPRRSCSCSRGTGVGWALRAVAPRAAGGRGRGGPRRRRRGPLRPAEPRAAGADAPRRRLPGPADRRARPGRSGAPGARSASCACGAPYTGPFQVPSVAWQLDVHTHDVQLDPVAPAVVLRARTTSRAPAGPACAASAARTGSVRSRPRRGGASSGPAG